MSGELSESESEVEDEQILILEATRSQHSPARKKRRLNNSQAHAQIYEDPSSSSSTNEDNLPDSDSEIKSNFDKQNSYQINVKNNKKRRKRHTQSQSQKSQRHKPIYKFGHQTYDIPLTVNPGAIVRLKLENFLCHDNFEISFHPNVNIIYGQNGAGKSAVEAGISMALGQNCKKTGRGNKIMDVIKDGKEWSKITLYLHNRGPEKLTEFGSEIIIERRLSKTGRNGASYFKVLDGDTLKSKGTGAKAVKSIADKFNLAVDNPCIILKQSVAKQFLNTSRATEKFKFFMQASKLGSYIKSLEAAHINVESARETQQQTKGSFVSIKNQYHQAKQKLDTLERMEEQKEKVKYWKRAEKYMIYDKEKDKIHGYKNRMDSMEVKIKKSNEQLEGLKIEMLENVERGKIAKQEIKEKSAQADRYKEPISELRKKMKILDKERNDIVRKVNAKHRFVDKSRGKITRFYKSYNEILNTIQNDERGRKLAEIQEKLTEYSDALQKYRTERDGLRDKGEKTIEMKENDQRLNSKQEETYNKKMEIDGLTRELNQLNQQRNRSENFLDPSLSRRSNNNNNYHRGGNISIYRIRQILQRYQGKFSCPPIGPLGEYICMKATDNQESDNRNIQIVQTVLRGSLYVFLVNTNRDQEIFRDIMSNEFNGKTVSCIQYPYSNQMEQINANPFNNYGMNERDGPLIRVSDMFSIKDNNPWIYNAILTNSQPERVYAHGDLIRAKSFLNSLNSNKLRAVNCIMTYRENKGLYKVVKSGSTVSGTPQRQNNPILERDTTIRKQWYENQLNLKMQEKNNIDREINELRRFVNENNRTVKEYCNKLIRLNGNIGNLVDRIEKFQRQQTDLQEEEEGNDELQSRLQELQASIEDEKMFIAQFEEDITPFKQEEEKMKVELTKYKKELHNIDCKVRDEKHSINMQRQQFGQIMDLVKTQGVQISKIPKFIEKFENELAENKQAYENEKERIYKLLSEAKALGAEIIENNYPRNPRNRNRKFSLIDLKRARMTLESEIEAWENELGDNNNPITIRKKFEMIKPKYEQHQERVDNCNSNVDEMAKLLRHRTKEYNEMKESVKNRLNMEFRYIMRQQGHDGYLIIDYEKGTLDMKTNMASHDVGTQLRSTSNMSGGERSFSQIAFIMALQKFSGSPMCIYDEFDVFMDSVNRGNSIKILLNAALGCSKNNNNNNNKQQVMIERQYIFITPNDVSPIIAEGHKDRIRIHQLKPPRRNR